MAKLPAFGHAKSSFLEQNGFILDRTRKPFVFYIRSSAAPCPKHNRDMPKGTCSRC